MLSFRNTHCTIDFRGKEVIPIDTKKLPDFQSFCESQFHLAHRAATVRDRRGETKIPASTVFSAVCLMGTLGLGALLSCDR